MSEARSPLELLGAIVDECEGLKRTHPNSYLPSRLMAEAKVLLGDVACTASGSQLNDVTNLVGRTVERVFDSDLRQGDLLLLCTDGSFVVLQAEGDSDSPYITTSHASYQRQGIKGYLRPADLLSVGLITIAQKHEMERAEHIERAEKNLRRAERDDAAASEALAKLRGLQTPSPLPEGSTTERKDRG